MVMDQSCFLRLRVPPERSQDCLNHWNFFKASHTWPHRARPPFWGFLPGYDWEMIKTCSVGRIRKTERKPQEEVTPGRKEGPPNLRFTSYPHLLEGKPADE